MKIFLFVLMALFVQGCGKDMRMSMADGPVGCAETGADRPEPPAGYVNALPDPTIDRRYYVWLRFMNANGLWCVHKGKARMHGLIHTNNSTYPPTVKGITGRDFVMFEVQYRTNQGERLSPSIRHGFRHHWYERAPNPWAKGLFWKPRDDV